MLWPQGRSARIQTYLRDPQTYETMDGLSRLGDFGYEVETIDTSPFPLNPLAKQGSLWGGFDFARFLRTVLRYRRYDAFISVGDTSCFFLAWAKKLLGLKTPIVLIDPALGYDYPRRRQVQQYILPHVNRVVVFGRVQLRYLQKEFGSRVKATHVLHRIDTNFFNPAKVAPPADDGLPLIASVGNDVMRDYETLIEAMRGLPVRLRIQTTRKIPGRLPDNVEVTSEWMSYEDLRALYARARLIAIPLKQAVHASGVNGVLEAMAMAKGIVISRSDGISDYVKPDHNALVVPVNDAAALRAAIRRMVDEPRLADELGRNARAFCETECALRVYSQQVARILDEEIAASRLAPR